MRHLLFFEGLYSSSGSDRACLEDVWPSFDSGNTPGYSHCPFRLRRDGEVVTVEGRSPIRATISLLSSCPHDCSECLLVYNVSWPLMESPRWLQQRAQIPLSTHNATCAISDSVVVYVARFISLLLTIQSFLFQGVM